MKHKLTAVQERFINFVVNRETVRIHRKAGALPPWTEDQIIANYRFCNINREDDYVTRWVKEHVRDPNTYESPIYQLRQVMVARIFNEPKSLQWVMPVQNLQRTRKRLHNLKAEGMPIFRGAYMMPSHPGPFRNTDSTTYYLRAVEDAEKLFVREGVPTYLRHVAIRLREVRGFGDFLVNQFVTDLRYLPYWRAAPDWSEFILCGPGTRRGIDRWEGEEPTGKRKQQYYGEALLRIRYELEQRSRFPSGIQTYFYDPNNLSNCFCEFDKYERAREAIATGKRPSLKRFTP